LKLKYIILSLGCAKNLVDSERFVAILKNYGFKEAETFDEADIVLVNSCAFLHDALLELSDTLSEILWEIDGIPTKLVVTGCVMNRGLQTFQEKFPWVDCWIPLKDFTAFERYLKESVLPPDADLTRKRLLQRTPLEQEQHVYLRIADGCENYCTYCLIPSIRGKLVSVPIEELVKEAKSLSRRGKELVLIAQDSCMYGTDIYGHKALPELIEALHEIKGFEWIRLMYLHPDHFELDWLPLWKKYPKLLPYFEIPIQHVSDRIIHAMNRKKGYAELKALFESIKTEIPQAVFRTTLMVGYPGETRADLDLIDKFLSEVDILHVGVFGYSPEQEGSQWHYPDDWDWDRTRQLELELTQKIQKQKLAKMERLVGTSHRAMVVDYDFELEALCARLWFQAPEIDGLVYFEDDSDSKEIMVEIQIFDVLDDEIWGELIEEQE
jgi:ribosomal protein S12 methylthiotransferase